MEENRGKLKAAEVPENFYEHNSVNVIVNIVNGAFFNHPNSSTDLTLANKLQRDSARNLYLVAKRNKIGLLFLQSAIKLTGDSTQITTEMTKELETETTAFDNIRQTMLRSAEVLNKADCRYVFIKSKYPFPVVPNDVDALVFGTRAEYERISKIMILNGFIMLERAQLECCFHDSLRGIHSVPKVKDPFDVDLYREVGAGHVIYMKKEKLIPHVRGDQINNVPIPVLNSPLEIALSIFHSIFPERMFTLLLYFHIIYAFRRMSKSEMKLFLDVCEDHKIKKAALVVLSIVERIQQLCSQHVDGSITSARESLGPMAECKLSGLPYIYPIRTIMEVFWDKKSDVIFSKSLTRQVMSMLSPKYAKYVASVNHQRSTRETY